MWLCRQIYIVLVCVFDFTKTSFTIKLGSFLLYSVIYIKCVRAGLSSSFFHSFILWYFYSFMQAKWFVELLNKIQSEFRVVYVNFDDEWFLRTSRTNERQIYWRVWKVWLLILWLKWSILSDILIWIDVRSE